MSGSQCTAYSEGRQRYSQCLLGLVVVGVEPVRRELLDVGFGQAARFGLAQALGQVQQGLGGEQGGRGRSGGCACQLVLFKKISCEPKPVHRQEFILPCKFLCSSVCR